MSTPTTPVLMSADNPEGWKLEALLQQLCLELYAKNDRIAGDPSPTARAVLVNNLGLIGLLALAEVRQRDTLARLAALRPDSGPGGTPRIGSGAAAVAAPAIPTPATGVDPALAAAAPAVAPAPQG